MAELELQSPKKIGSVEWIHGSKDVKSLIVQIVVSDPEKTVKINEKLMLVHRNAHLQELKNR